LAALFAVSGEEVGAISWSMPFADPIPLPRGRRLTTRVDAANYLQKLKKTERDLPDWQTAIHILIEGAEARDSVIHARIGVMTALNRNVGACSTRIGKTTDSRWGERGN
jgi:hypothetical protein